ncbi:hypothetical protein KY317_03450 [Candidatus Woesearchaeota archaeon]|nr:hypothetical protein [Candidatus Woesearchaeota archaeon]
MKIKIEDEIEHELETGESDETAEDLLENDEITPEEEAFIRGEKEASFNSEE